MKLESIFKNAGKACGNFVHKSIKISGDVFGAFYDIKGDEKASQRSKKVSMDIAKSSQEFTETIFEAVGIIADYAAIGGKELFKAIKEYGYVKDVHIEKDVEDDKIVEPVNFEVKD